MTDEIDTDAIKKSLENLLEQTADKESAAAEETIASKENDIGYAKPPAKYRFKKGISGNPKGRPRGSKNKAHDPFGRNLEQFILEEANRPISINEGNSTTKTPIAQAVVRSIGHNAVKGKIGAQRLYTKLLSETEAAKKQSDKEHLYGMIEYVERAKKEIEIRKRSGKSTADIVPHPDDIHINIRAMTVEIDGPLTLEEKDMWDHIKKRKQMLQESIPRSRELYSNEDDPLNEEFQKCIDRDEKMLDLINQFLDDPETRHETAWRLGVMFEENAQIASASQE